MVKLSKKTQCWRFLTPFIVDFFLFWGEISNFLSLNLKKHIRTMKIVSSGVEGTLERCLVEVFLYHLKKLLYLLHVWNKKFLKVAKNNFLCLKHCTSHNTTTSGLCLGTLTKTIWIFFPPPPPMLGYWSNMRISKNPWQKFSKVYNRMGKKLAYILTKCVGHSQTKCVWYLLAPALYIF